MPHGTKYWLIVLIVLPPKVEGGSVPENFGSSMSPTGCLWHRFLGLTMECTRCHDHKYDPEGLFLSFRLF